MIGAELRVRGLTKSYGSLMAVSDVSFDAPASQLTALVGPNGAGKTTVFNLVTNLFRADSGEVRLAGVSLAGRSAEAIAELGLIRTFQTARIFASMTALENVLVGAHRHLTPGLLKHALWLGSARREERALEARARGLFELFGLEHYAQDRAVDLPMGAQKLIEVMRALMAEPRLLLLDEPAAGLNDKETAELATILDAIRGLGITILIVEHNMSLVMTLADQVVVLDAGALVTVGDAATVARDPRVIEAYLGDFAVAEC